MALRLNPWIGDATMRILSKMVVNLVVVVLTVAPAQAQRVAYIPGFGYPATMLAGNKGVQHELKVDDSQAEKIDALVERLRENNREQFQKLQDVPKDERPAKRLELTQAINGRLREGLVDILKPAQIKRFDQIQLQTTGFNAFATSRVQGALKLTAEQKSRLDGVIDEQDQAIRTANQSFQDDREGTLRKVAELRKQGIAKAIGLLTDSQTATWKDMTGEPFEVRFEPLRPNN
jgi:Spy/CpxP family protein refolding chaperone